MINLLKTALIVPNRINQIAVIFNKPLIERQVICTNAIQIWKHAPNHEKVADHLKWVQ